MAQAETPSDLLLTPSEVAHALKIGKSKAYQLIADGDIAAVRVGSLLRVPRESLLRYVDALSGVAHGA